MPPAAHIPELLSPAGSIEAAFAALANGADAVYLGAERFNARDEGAQLSLDELALVCRAAHERGRRVYLTLNTLLKPCELADALVLLGECIDRGVDAAIVQDVGLVRLIHDVFPGFELHGSTQMTVHDAHGAALLGSLGLQRVVLARENTLEDIRAIHAAVPTLELEAFIHGALCISYSGQCLMSGMISERSANRGSCAQSCRKEYVLADANTAATLDRGYLISARDLAAHEHLDAIARAGVRTLKIEGRKKRPEYVATVTRTYRALLERLRAGQTVAPTSAEAGALVQIYSRGFTGGMFGGRTGRAYVTREQGDNRGVPLGTVVGHDRGAVLVAVSEPLAAGDGVAFEPPPGSAGQTVGCTVRAVRTMDGADALVRQALSVGQRVPLGWRVVRSSHAALLERARASYAAWSHTAGARRERMDVRVAGSAGRPLKATFTIAGQAVTEQSVAPLAPASRQSLSAGRLREQLGRLGESPFVLGALDDSALAPDLFLPVSALNQMRQRAVERLIALRDRSSDVRAADRRAHIGRVVAAVVAAGARETGEAPAPEAASGAFQLSADVYRVDDAIAAAQAGATDIAFDPFLRHPVPPRSRLRRLADELATNGCTVRLRTPTIVRPGERAALEPWLALGLPIVSGHAGLAVALAREGSDVTADYAVNCFNQHTAAEFFDRGVRRIVLSVELTVEELAAAVAPWRGRGFDAVIHGRPEGMTIEHCVLSAAFDRVPGSCRDLCVQQHPAIELTDPAGYTFPVATDAACRNRLLHSRPIDGAEYLPALWHAGIRGYRLLFNVAGLPVAEITAAYRNALDALAAGAPTGPGAIRALVGGRFTRGHFARAV